MRTKDFQEATAKRILEIFKSERQNRILLADEVGLGKTIVARAVIDKVFNWHMDEKGDDHFKVVYVCSNINIANQNYQKLVEKEQSESLNVSESRLSMLHLRIYKDIGFVHEKLQLITLTPATSFLMTGGQGMKSERALIYPFLIRHKELKNYPSELKELLRFDKTIKDWEWTVQEAIEKVLECNNIKNNYILEMSNLLEDQISPTLYDQILAICSKNEFGKGNAGIRRNIINSLRKIFAQISLEKLEPDLVIMDEFQRFKDLIIEKEDECGMISSKFLHTSETKVLLLSATPYKPYSTFEELSHEDGGHYEEFMTVMDFLLYEKNRKNHFQTVWKDYSGHLAELKTDNLTVLIAHKNIAEDELYQCVCRTERKSSNMIDTSKATEVRIGQEDVLSYMEMQRILNRLNLGNFPIEYVKSSPYLLSFMNYKIKEKIEWSMKEGDRLLIQNSRTSLLGTKMINGYKPIGCNNARLRLLFDEVFGIDKNNAELLLWIPASKPYYETDNVFSKNSGYSKLLVFSAWEMVPRMIAGLASYEAERLAERKFASQTSRNVRDYFPETKTKRKVRVRLRDDTANLIHYPSTFLAGIYNPLNYQEISIAKLRAELKIIVDKKINEIKELYGDTVIGRGGAEQILVLLKALDGEDQHAFLHVITEEASNLLVNMAIGSPGVCAFRIFKDKDKASLLGNSFVSLFNKQESATILDVLYGKREEFYYEDVMRYCAEGNLQAVLDEYVYVIGKEDRLCPNDIKSAFIDTVSIAIDTDQTFGITKDKPRLRSHFAVGYFDTKISEKSVQRTENIRTAFNSPFRPFVLATTSIGQEGLDFHSYCRKIMHWNLPANPVDLEQREGRINRYLCHAIRQNIASSEFGNISYKENVWQEMFENAKLKLKGNSSELIPYWCLPDTFDFTRKIERIVPMYPFSQDRIRYDRLIEVLSLYRLTLGQPRQEELFEALKKDSWGYEQVHDLFLDLSPFSRKNDARDDQHYQAEE